MTLHVDRAVMLPMFMFMEAVADEPISLETVTKELGVNIRN